MTTYTKGQTVQFHSMYEGEGIVTGTIISARTERGYRGTITTEYYIRQDDGGYQHRSDNHVIGLA